MGRSKPPSKEEAPRAIQELLQEHFDTTDVAVWRDGDFVKANARGLQWRFYYEGSTNHSRIERGLKRLKSAKRVEEIAAVVTSYMSASMVELCKEWDLPWMDLSGNAHVVTEELFLKIRGEPNKFKRSTSVNPFAKTSERIPRALLVHAYEHKAPPSQQALAEETGVSPAYTSRAVRALASMGYVDPGGRGDGVKVIDHAGLLDAWSAESRFDAHQASFWKSRQDRNHDEVLEVATGVFQREDLEYALTGHTALRFYDEAPSDPQMVSFVDEVPETALAAGFEQVAGPMGADLWLYVPSDDGVYYGTTQTTKPRLVHILQAYIDVIGSPTGASTSGLFVPSIRDRLLSQMKANN